MRRAIFAIVAATLTCCLLDGAGAAQGPVAGDSPIWGDLPSQPGEDTWRFIEGLKTPMWTRHPWRASNPGARYADLSGGVQIRAGFPDPRRRLDTAYDDLRAFLAAGGVSSDSGVYTIETVAAPDLEGEAFRLEVGPGTCRILASDTEGIRRGIFHVEDEMLRQRGPFLPSGTIERRPFIKRRISRCFFGPIKRPPRMRDELMDETDYYPDQYLNRLAHEGVNGLWLTVAFGDLVSTSFTPEAGKDGQRRLAKLRRTAASCLRYGIRTYIFCIEPRAWNSDSPALRRHPELGGSPSGSMRYFCPSSETAHKYLYESVRAIFKAVPELGGMINISHGERATTCLSALSATGEGRMDCPRCSRKAPWEILHASLAAMERGMHDTAPDAELISWLYMPQPQRFGPGDSYNLADWVYELPAHTPQGVILQFNFESGVRRTEFGKELVGGDYWISNPGPSSRFERVAAIAKQHRTSVSAKIQTGSSHEVATVPFVPVPSLLFRKFAEMRRLGVSYTMLCWYFGNYPGLMNKAAGELSFEPFPADEDSFLRRLASIYWKDEDAPRVVEAWKQFSSGYESYPLTNMFQYYGPMHDGPVWPLLLKPADATLSPTWQIGSSSTRRPWPPSGDRIGECIGEVLTLQETVELARRMATAWDRGVAILGELELRYRGEPERILDIGVARALGIQFRSGYNILRFYLLRDEMLHKEGAARLELLNRLSALIREEFDQDEKLLALCERDSRLGFHSEAEGYKYFPAKIRWRMQQLRNVLARDVPELTTIIRKGEPLYPEFTGEKPVGPTALCVGSNGASRAKPGLDLPADLNWQSCDYGKGGAAVRWASFYDAEALHIVILDSSPENPSSAVCPISSVQVKIEPRRLWPCQRFILSPGAETAANAGMRVSRESGVWRVVLSVPLRRIGLDAGKLHPVRIDVRVQRRNGEIRAWRPDNPITSRLLLGSDNPADLGWLLFGK